MAWVRRHLSYANVMSTLAVFGVLGGGVAVAAGLAKDSVKSKQIKAGAVKNAELADDAVTSPKVAAGSLLSSDFAAGQLPQGATGPKGATGVQGPTGPSTGAAGGDLTGNYPNPEIAAAVVGTSEQGTVPAVQVRNMAATIPSSSSTTVAFANQVVDTDNMFSAGQPDRVTINTPGWYAVMGFVDWVSNATGTRRVRLNVPFDNPVTDGDFAGEQVNAVATDFTQQTVSGVRHFNAGQTLLGLRVLQTSGTSLGVNNGVSPTLTAVWIAP